jgi:hypothetical protein
MSFPDIITLPPFYRNYYHPLQFQIICPFLNGKVVCLRNVLSAKKARGICLRFIRNGNDNTMVDFRLLSTLQYNSLSNRIGQSFSYTIMKRPERLMLCASISTDVAASGQRNLYRSFLLLGTPLLPDLTILFCPSRQTVLVERLLLA